MTGILVIIFVTIHVVLSEDNICSREYICQGREGDIITIPCGPAMQQNGTTFTYYNESSKIILLRKSSNFLRLNLSVFDDKSVIRCQQENETSVDYYSYILSVTYSPRVIGNVPNPYATYNQQFFIECPLTSNPKPVCSWILFDCFSFNNTFNATQYGVSFPLEDGCLLYINKVSLLFRYVCYTCNATNDLGSSSISLNNIDFPYCTGNTIIMSPQPNDEESNVLSVQKDQNITLKCEGFGYGRLKSVVWCFDDKSASGNASCQVDNRTIYNEETCHKVSFFTKENASENDTGTYSCFFDIDDFKRIDINVVPKQIYQKSSTEVHRSVIIGIVLGGFIIIVILSVASAFAAIIIKRRCNRVSADGMKFMRLTSADLGDTEYYFDAFVSFAEEDKEAAELSIKKPLEVLGYNICWHHDDFVPGCTVNENIESCILRSKLMIALISRAFFLSNFCKSELEISRRKIQKTGQNCLVPIMIEQWNEVPTELLKITYIDIDDKLLIPRLQNILGVPIDSVSIS